MSTIQLEEPWTSLLNLLRQSQPLSADAFASAIEALSLETELIDVLVTAIRGDNRPMNTWLFSRPDGYDEPLVWIAPVTVGSANSYAWMIGRQSSEQFNLRRRFVRANTTTGLDPLLLQKDVPPPLLFVDPIEISRISHKKMREGGQDEFAVFQTNYKGARAEVSDFEQRMILNTAYLVAARRRALARMGQFPCFDAVIEVIERNVRLFALAHTEGHNQGHFLGPWPFVAGKGEHLYEAPEEFRACLAAIRLAEHLGFSEEQLDAFAVSIFATRFFEYGFDAYLRTTQRRETAREITVGLMFFETLVSKGVLVVDTKHSVHCELDLPNFRQALLATLGEIHDAEAALLMRGNEGLKDLARIWYGRAFPNGSYSAKAEATYLHLKEEEVK